MLGVVDVFEERAPVHDHRTLTVRRREAMRLFDVHRIVILEYRLHAVRKESDRVLERASVSTRSPLDHALPDVVQSYSRVGDRGDE